VDRKRAEQGHCAVRRFDNDVAVFAGIAHLGVGADDLGDAVAVERAQRAGGASAPGRLADTRMVGYSMLGSAAIGRKL